MSKELVKPADVLTSEQLANIQKQFILAYMDDSISTELMDLIVSVDKSHKSLLSANAELSFENMKLKEAKKLYEKALGFIADATYEGPAEALKWRDIANDALEAFDHE